MINFEFNDTIEAELWANSFFVFDTSALIDLYYYSDDTQNEIFKIFEQLTNKLSMSFS